ncbi:MAG: DUF3575 domain-containing protein [Alistipes sp.]|nr:DUF3575 domain-containing protein [Alistipes sp.]
MFAKNHILLTLSLVVAAVVMPLFGVAQQTAVTPNTKVENRGISVDFRVNSIVIDPAYRNNAKALEQIDSLYNVLMNDSSIEIVAIEFCGTASPEGSAALNHRLSHGRLLALEKIVRDKINIPQEIVTEVDHYIAWDHLISLVENDNTLPMREEVLEILRGDYPTTTDLYGREIDGRITELRKIQGGAVWSTMHKKYFDQMRNAWFIVVTTRKVEPEPVVEPEPTPEPEPEPTVEPIVEPIVEPEPEPIVESERPRPIMNIKTNALEVAGLIANLGFEVKLAQNLSLDVIGHYSPYDYFKFDRKIRVFAIQPEVRYWFGETLIKGHFVGLHVPVSGFNVQLGDKRYQDPNRAIWGVGLSYGYAMPLGKDSNWGVEFTVGLGYMNIVYDVYEGVLNGKYQETKKMNYFGPTRLGIDFSYRINSNKKSNKEKTLGK